MNGIEYWAPATPTAVSVSLSSPKYVSLDCEADMFVEGAETLALHVRAVDQPDSEVVLEPTIFDLQNAFSFEAEVTAAREGDHVTLGLSAPADVILEYWVADVSAVNNTDYYGPSSPQTVTVGPSQGTTIIYFGTTDDSLWEPTRSFAVHVRVQDAPESEVVLEATILDDDAVTFTAEVTPAGEGSNVTVAITATLPEGVSSATLQYWTVDASATGAPYSGMPGDYLAATSWPPSMVTVYANSTVYLDIPTYDDAVWEGTESFEILLQIPGYEEAPLILEADILDNDALQFWADIGGIPEGNNLTLALFTHQPVELEYWLVEVSAELDVDYEADATAGTLTVDGFAYVNFPTLDDALVETTESFAVHVRMVGHPETEVVLEADILDDDGRTFTALVQQAVEGSDVVLKVWNSQAVEVEWWLADVSAVGGADYAVASGTVGLNGQYFHQVQIPTFDDALHETTESFAVHLRIVGHPASEIIVEARILDNDEASSENVITQVVQYQYDYLNRLIARTADADGDGQAAATTEYFVHDGDQIILRLDADGSVLNRYTWGTRDQLLVDEQVTPESAVTRWALGNQQNSVRDLVQLDVNGTASIVNHRTFTAFGAPLNSSAVDSIFGYTGKFYDPLTELQSNIERWLDLWLHQFIGPDPSGLGPDVNPYRYVHNDPINKIDPDGLEETEPGAAQRFIRHLAFGVFGDSAWDWLFPNHDAPKTYRPKNTNPLEAQISRLSGKDRFEAERLLALVEEFDREGNRDGVRKAREALHEAIAAPLGLHPRHDLMMDQGSYVEATANQLDWMRDVSQIVGAPKQFVTRSLESTLTIREDELIDAIAIMHAVSRENVGAHSVDPHAVGLRPVIAIGVDIGLDPTTWAGAGMLSHLDDVKYLRLLDDSPDLARAWRQGTQLAGHRRGVLPPDDPVLDNSVFSAIVHGDPDALKFAGRNRGLMTVIDSTLDEALRRYNVDDIEHVMREFGISSIGDPTSSDIAAMMARIQAARPGRVPTAIDTSSIVVADLNGVRLVSGDRRVVLDAAAVGVDVRARLFDPPLSINERIEFYEKVRKALKTIGTKNPHSITGGR